MLYMFAPTVTEASQIVSPSLVDGRWLLPGDQNAVVVPSALLRDEPHLRLGGEMVLKIDGRERSFRIVGTYIGTSFAAMIFTPYDYMAKVTNRMGETDALMVSADQHEPGAVEALSNALEQHLEGQGVKIGTVSSMQSERTEAEAIFNSDRGPAPGHGLSACPGGRPRLDGDDEHQCAGTDARDRRLEGHRRTEPRRRRDLHSGGDCDWST